MAYRNGKKWAEDMVVTTGEPAMLQTKADREKIKADGKDLAFITIEVADNKERLVPRTDNLIEFSIEGPGEIVATDNGDPTDMVPFPSLKRKAFNGLALVIVLSQDSNPGAITVRVKSSGLQEAVVQVRSY